MFSLTLCVFGQVNDKAIRKLVLNKGIVDSLFVFGKWNEKGKTETHLQYLGQVTTNDQQVYKVMNSCWLWGLSHRATSRILIYNGKNEYVGNYYIYDINDLPIKLDNGILIFKSKIECDKSIVTKIDLTRGIPKQIFIECESGNGDLYNFETE